MPLAKTYAIEDPDFPAISVVIPVLNERRTLPRVIAEAKRLSRNTEIIVIANGCRDGSGKVAQRLGAKVISYPGRLGHDVGRAIGASEASGDIMIFIDADFVVRAGDLAKFARAVASGVDVALNHYNGPVRRRSVHSVVLAKHVLNEILGRPDLQGCSLTTIPHALSKKAVTAVEPRNLMVPPKAHAIACLKGLTIKPVHFIPVGRLNRTKRPAKRDGQIRDLIFGDHLEAIQTYLECSGERGGRADCLRQRSKVR
ncbi:MAG TPA: glycosyltransferase [Bacilli bacterium]